MLGRTATEALHEGRHLGKTALIVDDSRSARFVLKRMLETHQLDVDTAESAEDALEYLCDKRPDVIFMDHLMPGMDGFQAVTAIKNNPDTATIPIMMYTSQKGEVYVGQARALGAVGVLPKQVEPVEVSKVLESLRVIDREARTTDEGDAADTGTGAAYPNLEKLDTDLRALIQDLFDQQRAILRRDMLDSYETIAARVVDEIRPVDTDDVEPGADTDDHPVTGRLRVSIAVLAVITMVFAWLYWQREQSWQQLQQHNAELVKALDEQQQIEAEVAGEARRQLDGYRESLQDSLSYAMQAIEWGANRSARYAFDEIPLGDSRRELLEELSVRLIEMGFTGIVRIDSHVGNFCMVDGGPRGYVLADPNIGADQCDTIGYPADQVFELGLQQSVSFANFIAINNGLADRRILYEVVSHGDATPLIEYPISPVGIGAGVWNDIAATNNRVEISIYPEER